MRFILAHSQSRWIQFAVLFVAWIGANGVLTSWLGVYPVLSKVSWQARRAYAAKRIEIGDKRLAYRIYVPPDHAGPLPLLVILHGGDRCGDDNLSQLLGFPEHLVTHEWRGRLPCIILVPQCPASTSWLHELGAIEQLVEMYTADPRVDKQRVYLTGLSMGGYGTWALSAKRPELFAAAVPICGGGDKITAPRLVDLPIWAIHGSADETIPVSASRTMIEAIRAAGGQPRYTELSGVGHDCWMQTYRDRNGVLTWMFQQVNERCNNCR